MTAGVLAEHERRLRHADFLGPHDLVGAAILQHPVLVNPRFVRERVAADDRLVRLHALARQRREQLTRREDLARVDPGGKRQAIGADPRRHHDLFE